MSAVAKLCRRTGELERAERAPVSAIAMRREVDMRCWIAEAEVARVAP